MSRFGYDRAMGVCGIKLDRVSLSIPIVSSGQDRLLRRPAFLSNVGGGLSRSNGKVHVDALKNISLELVEGEHIALIGHNGAGKTTLLRVVAGIYPATYGEVSTQGSIGCVFEGGGGISPDLTGRECIKYYSLIYGRGDFHWREVEADVGEFTELGGFLDLPMRTYSSGMLARLSAALATAWRQDILLVDEGIGAGDQAFQKKFAARLHSFMTSAGILMLASHTTDLLRQYCKKGLVLVHGTALFYGDIEDALKFYSEWQLGNR